MAMWLANKKEMICSKYWLHDPEKRNKNGNTVAMLLVDHSDLIIPPKEWEHKPELTNNEGKTVAMILADNLIVPPK